LIPPVPDASKLAAQAGSRDSFEFRASEGPADEGDASGIAGGNVFDRARRALKLIAACFKDTRFFLSLGTFISNLGYTLKQPKACLLLFREELFPAGHVPRSNQI
jgi:hypothetical protein